MGAESPRLAPGDAFPLAREARGKDSRSVPPFRNEGIQPADRSRKQIGFVRFHILRVRRPGTSVLSAQRRFSSQSAIKLDHFRRDASVDQLINGKMCVASSRSLPACGAAYFCIRQTDEIRDSPQFAFCVLEKRIVMCNESVFPVCCLNQALVVDFPEPQTKRIGSSVSFLHRVRDFEWIAHRDQSFQPGQQVLPERQRQTVAGVLPAPELAESNFSISSRAFRRNGSSRACVKSSSPSAAGPRRRRARLTILI